MPHGDGWEVVLAEVGQPRVRRFRVVGGHLYQVSTCNVSGREYDDMAPWHPPVFVPAKVVG